jgi:hypothetical protein
MSQFSPSFSAEFDDINQEIVLSGRIRPSSPSEMAGVLDVIRRSLNSNGNVIYLNIKRVTHLNMTAFRCLEQVLTEACKTNLRRG